MTDPGKEACFMLLDVNCTMKAHLADAKLALKSQVTSKILFKSQDVLGIGLVGTDCTDNMVHDELGEGQYEHVSVVKQMTKATFSSLAALDAAACSGARGDLVDGLVVATDAINRFVKKLKFGKRIILVTDGNGYVESEAECLDEIAENMANEGIRLTVIGVGLSADIKPEGGVGGASAREQFMRCLGRFREKLGDRFELKELAETVHEGLLGGKEVKSTKAYQGALQFGSLMSLPVVCWRRVSKGSAIKLCSVSKAALADGDGEGEGEQQRRPDQTVAIERRYFSASQPDDEVPPELRQAAYTYGKDMVPVTSQDEEAMKYGVAEKCMQLVGMVPHAAVPRYWFMNNAQCVVGDPSEPYAHVALSALGLAMEEEGLVAIVRCAQRKGATPRPYCLSPGARCLYLNALPFGDELRRVEWHGAADKDTLSAAQQDAADALVDALDFCQPVQAGGASSGLGRHAVRPKDVANPEVQRKYQAIVHKALRPGEALPAADWRVLRPLQPDPALFGAAKTALDDFARACPTAREEREEKKRSWVKRADTDAASAIGGGDPPAKQMRAAEAAAAGATLALKASRVETIDSGRPVETFWAMVRDQEQNRLLEAFDQMAAVIHTLLETAPSHEDAAALKGFACLRELRRAAVQEEEPEAFNVCLRKLKAQCLGSATRTPFWAAVVSDPLLQPGLITRDETEESDITPDEAAAFVATEMGATQDGDAAAAWGDDDDDEYGGLE